MTVIEMVDYSEVKIGPERYSNFDVATASSKDGEPLEKDHCSNSFEANFQTNYAVLFSAGQLGYFLVRLH